jgi:adiponectin receptor
MYKERIGTPDESHKFLLDNQFIHKGYRLYFNSIQKISKSIFMLHNETVNIWTHALGSLLFVYILFLFIFSTDYSSNSLHYKEYISSLHSDFIDTKYSIQNKLFELIEEIKKVEVDGIMKSCDETMNMVLFMLDRHENSYDIPLQDVSRWPLLIYILSVVVCLVCSSVFHIFNAQSKFIKSFVITLDYIGISILICGSFFPPIYYIFYCNESLIYFYLISIVLASAIVFILISLISTFKQPYFKHFKNFSFLGLGLLGLVPIVHMSYL